VKTGQKYGAEYVNRLAAMLRRHTSKVVPFICITDDAKGLADDIENIPARYPELQGWWQKPALFGGYGFEQERLLFLDLDTVIVGNVDFLFEYEGPFAILRDFYHPVHYGSAIMSIAPGFGRHVWDRFRVTPDTIIQSMWGDQDWIKACVPHADLWQDLCPGKIVSYKADEVQTRGVNGASIVCLHGLPKQTDLARTDPIRQAWEKA
jgi:hypothetical protein